MCRFNAKRGRGRKKVTRGWTGESIGWGRGAGRERYYVVALSFSSISSDIPLSHGSLASEWVWKLLSPRATGILRPAIIYWHPIDKVVVVEFLWNSETFRLDQKIRRILLETYLYVLLSTAVKVKATHRMNIASGFDRYPPLFWISTIFVGSDTSYTVLDSSNSVFSFLFLEIVDFRPISVKERFSRIVWFPDKFYRFSIYRWRIEN